MELLLKGYKRLFVLRLTHTTAGFIPQRDHRKNNLYKNIYRHTLCDGKKLENEGMPSNWEMAEQIVVSFGDGMLLCSKNNKLEKFHMNWNDLQELMQSERSRTRRTLYTEA